MHRTGFVAALLLAGTLAAASCASAVVDVVKDGKPTATIVTPDNPTETAKYAAQELQYHVKESTGATLPIVKESESPKTGSVIFLGPCEATAKAGIDCSKIGINGFVIKTIGGNLYIVGHDTDGGVFSRYSTAGGCWTRSGTLFGVYEFVEKEMNVKWLWPGKLGEIIPKRTDLTIGNWDLAHNPRIIHSRWRDGGTYHGGPSAWSSEKAWWNYKRDQGVWLRRHRISTGVDMDIRHAFTDYWKRFSATNPEFFQQLPDGTRRPDPTNYGGAPSLISMCVSQPSLIKQIVDNWKATRTEQVPFIDVSENDTPGVCTCDACMSWDVPDPKAKVPFDQRLARAKEAFEKEEASWTGNLGNVSDRYCRFYMEVLKEAEKVDPNAVVMGLSYANYVTPPLKTKLNERVVIAIVPPVYFPWTPEKQKAVKEQWDGWAATGCSLMLRPNYTLDGHAFPIFYAKKVGDDFTYASKHGLIATDFDSLTGQWATQGPNLYMVGQKHAHPEMPTDKILDEYYNGFGKASKAVKAYFGHWEKVSNSVTEEEFRKEAKPFDGDAYARFYPMASKFFTPEVMAKGRSLLYSAAAAANGDAVAEQRVTFLQKGLTNAELTLAAQEAYVKYKATGDMEPFRAAVHRLDSFRRSAEKWNISNVGFLRWSEGLTWDRSELELLKDPVEPLSAKWKFSWDLKNEGIDKSWFAEETDTSTWYDIGIDSPWENQDVGKAWQKEHGNGYDGFAWYTTSFTVDRSEEGKPVRIIFGAVDEACKVWVNGQMLLDRPFPYNGNTSSWQEAFDVDVTKAIRFDKPNTLVVRVEDNGGAGGIWRPVWITDQRR